MKLSFKNADAAQTRKLRALISAEGPSDFEGALSTEQTDFLCEKLYVQNLLHQGPEAVQRYMTVAADGIECGYGSIIPQGPDLFFMTRIFISQGYRRMGIGTAFFVKLADLAVSLNNGPCSIEVMVNHHNPERGFYLKQGMVKVREYCLDMENFAFSDDILSIRI